MTQKDFNQYLFDDYDWLKELFNEFNSHIQTYISYNSLAKYLLSEFTFDKYMDFYENCDDNFKNEISYVRKYVTKELEDLMNEFVCNLEIYKKEDDKNEI